MIIRKHIMSTGRAGRANKFLFVYFDLPYPVLAKDVLLTDSRMCLSISAFSTKQAFYLINADAASRLHTVSILLY